MNTDTTLAAGVRMCTACPLHQHRTIGVPAEVGANYEPGGLGFLLEAPGRNEDEQGRPLVGAAGRVFDSLLHDIGIARDEVLLMNRVRCRPPGNRIKDYPEAVVACDQWTQRELAAYQPGAVVLMGATSISAYYGQVRVGDIRGTWQPLPSFVVVPTYHPAALIYNHDDELRRLVLSDILLARSFV